MTKKVIIPLPDNDFDTTEVSIPWKYFVDAGFEVTFSTEKGKVAQTDPRLLTGVIFGQLGAKPDAIAAYRELEKLEAFQHPIPYDAIDPQQYDLLLLPGGHAKGMRQYLESKIVQQKADGPHEKAGACGLLFDSLAFRRLIQDLSRICRRRSSQSTQGEKRF